MARNKLLLASLIGANLLMLVIAIITIPPNFRKTQKVSDNKRSLAGESSDIDYQTDYEPSKELESSDIDYQADETPSKELEGPDIDYSTAARPDLSDFLWYTEEVQYDGVPSEATVIDNIEPLIGGWKALIIYDPNNEMESYAMEFLNINLTGTKEGVSLLLDWYMIFWGDGQGFDETDMEDSVFTGRWDETGLWASGPGTIRLNKFYSINNRQYAIGTMDTPDGTPAFIAMVRP